MDTLGRSFVFEGYGREKGINPEYRLFYKVNFDGSDLTLLTPGDGFHSIDLAKNGKYLIDNYSRADQEPIAELRDTKGRKIMELERPDLRLLYEMGWRKPERVKVKAADGITDLYGVMYQPFDMDSTRKYPIIINVYPGPQENFVPQSFRPPALQNSRSLQNNLLFRFRRLWDIHHHRQYRISFHLRPTSNVPVW